MTPYFQKVLIFSKRMGLYVLFILFLLKGNPSQAQGGLLVYPKRVVFTDHQQFEKLNITNTGKDSTHYNISVINIKMGADGGFIVMDSLENGHQFADSYFRFFPREITLAPNESQTVKLQRIRNAELSNGEYRSHLYFRQDPDSKVGTKKQSPNFPDDDVSIKITPTFGISIPVIIRKGEVSAKVSLSDFSLHLEDPADPKVVFELNRTGNSSVYGDIEVIHVSKNRTVKVVGLVRGLAVYTPNSKRLVKIPLNMDSETDLSSGILKISFKEDKHTYFVETLKL